jgi:Flp pilus assembly secretin CpaC
MLKLAALFAAALTVLQYALAERASKNDGPAPEIRVVRNDATARLLMLRLNEAMAIDVPADIQEILVADSETAGVVVRTLRRVHIVEASVGRTNVVFYDDHDRQILALDVSVSPQMVLRHRGVFVQFF